MNPIWKDFYVMLTDPLEDFPDGCRYRVLDVDTGTVLFEGRAFPRPGASELYIRINDIIEPHLRAVLPLEGDDCELIGVRVERYENGSWVTTDISPAPPYYFVRDWSYDRTVSAPGELNPCRPIIPRVHPLQHLPEWADDGVFDIVLGYIDAIGDYNADYSDDYFVTGARELLEERTGSGVTTHFWPMADYLGAVSVEVWEKTYPVAGCERFILYYVNAYGGWDWLPVEGKTQESDAITRHTYDAVYDNRTAPARGRFNHVNELQHKYTFYTGWLTDAQSALMHHLLNSVLVYVHDTVTGEVLPLVLTGSTTEHKRNGLNQYTITADLAQERLRR